MQDIDLYRQLLGLATPWTVLRVELKVKEQRVEVWAGHADSARWPCPECPATLPLYDHAEERTWRHLDSCQFQTYLHARPPRVQCPTHGVRQVRLPWAEPRARFTTLFERLAIDVLRETDVQGATRLLRISWDEAWEIKRRAVARGRARRRPHVPARLGVDETAAARGHDYVTLVCDLTEGTVEYLADERKQGSLDGYFTALTPAQRGQIQAVAMDMWEPYVQSVQTYVPQADRKIVFDPFHIVQHMNGAVDQVRRQEQRLLRAQGDVTLTGSKYLWLYGEENIPDHQRDRFTELTRRTSRKKLKTARAWALKESLRDLWRCRSQLAAEQQWQWWYGWATRARLAPVLKVAQMVKRHLPNVLTYFRHRITNAMSEGIASKIQALKKTANGFRNRENFKTAIYFHCGGLDLYPDPTH
jgi:transposase